MAADARGFRPQAKLAAATPLGCGPARMDFLHQQRAPGRTPNDGVQPGTDDYGSAIAATSPRPPRRTVRRPLVLAIAGAVLLVVLSVVAVQFFRARAAEEAVAPLTHEQLFSALNPGEDKIVNGLNLTTLSMNSPRATSLAVEAAAMPCNDCLLTLRAP